MITLERIYKQLKRNISKVGNDDLQERLLTLLEYMYDMYDEADEIYVPDLDKESDEPDNDLADYICKGKREPWMD